MSAAVTLDIAELLPAFPGFRVAVVVATGLEIAGARPPTLAADIARLEAAAAADLRDVELGDIPELACWRAAYRAFGVKKTSYRSSVERLLKNLQRGGGLPRVNALVDGYNAVSSAFRMPVGADDLDRVRAPLAFRYAQPGDSFFALGDATATDDPPKPGEVVYADADKILCRRWNWYQDARSAIGPTTHGAVLTVQALTPTTAARVETVADSLRETIAAHCGGRVVWAVADRTSPLVTVPIP